MQKNVRVECPQCANPLDKFNGHIGYCPVHGWVSPAGLGFEAEAATKKSQEAAAAEKARLIELQKAAKKEEEERRKRHREAVCKAVTVIVALAAVAAAVVFFIVRPSLNYGRAFDAFAAGNYRTAKDIYSGLGDYKDSTARALLCDAMTDLGEGRPEDAVAKLDQLMGEGQDDVARELADAMAPVIANWKDRGLTPQALLLLLGKADVIDRNGVLNTAKLTEEGHTALLDGSQLAVYTKDVTGDENPELIVLNPDYGVTVYRMAAGGNVRVAVDNDTAAACETAFGNQFKGTDADVSIACFAEAYRLAPNDDTRAALTAAYQFRSVAYENAGDMDAAIADARSAMDTAGTADAFTFFYDVNLRNSKNGHDAAEAIVLWDAFAEASAMELTRFSAKDRWQADAAQLHIALAAELAARKDEGCIAELRTAAAMGADVAEAVADAESHFDPGLSLARLRLMEIDLLGADEAKAQQARADMAGEVRAAIGEWKARGISPADVPALVRLADGQGIDLSGLDRDAIYQEAALAAVGNVAQDTFVDWDGDGYQELLTMDAGGNLALYGTDETWKALSTVDTRLAGAAYTIADESAPLILVLSAGQDEMLALTGTGDRLSTLFRESGICRYRAAGAVVTFSRLLDGSITRYNDYTYQAVGTESRPVRTGIDWQQQDYPQPKDAAAAVQRYFEARAYDIPDEAAHLTGVALNPGIFTADGLAALPAPDVPGTVNAAAYRTEDGLTQFEVTYSSGAQAVRTWVSVEFLDGGWKLTGAADTYGAGMAANEADYSVSLISLNAETVDTISEKGGRKTYRVLIPSAGRLSLLWQSGSKAVSRVSHIVTMYRGSLTGDTVFGFQLQPSPNKQRSKDLFVSAGVYYVTVEAGINNAEEYCLALTYEADAHVELESNDTSATATAVEHNTGYSAALIDSKDTDYFSFTLDATSAVNVTLAAPGNGSKSAVYTLTVFSAADGGSRSSISVPGNVQLAETGSLYLSAGAYLVQVTKGSAFTDDPYVLTVTVDQNGVMESEANNTPETANAVPVNEDIHASIGQEGDIDCFTFTLEGDAVLQPRFTFTPTDSASKTYVLTVLDAGRRELLKTNIGGKESTKVIAPMALTAGTYTVKVENPRFVRQGYTLRLVSAAVDYAEKEPNDSAAFATALAVGQPRTGVLTTEADVDYYKLVFPEETTVTLKFSFPQSTAQGTAFVLTLEQNGRTQLTTNLKADSGGTEQKLQFPAGEYYLRVKSSTWLSAVYTVIIEE